MGILSNIKNKGTAVYHGAKLALGPHKSDICFIAGMTLLGVGIFGLCKASMKLPEKTDNLEKKINDIAKKEHDGEITTEQAQADIRSAKFEFGKDVAKDYALGGAVVIAGVGAITNAHISLKTSNAVLASAAIAAQDKLNQYRARVVADQGQAKDTYYATGAEPIIVKKTVTDENGNPVETSVAVGNRNPGDIQKDLTQIRIHPSNPYWKNDPGMMLTWIKGRFNEIESTSLYFHGVVMRNEICDLFGVERDNTQEGLRAGIIRDKNNSGQQIDYAVHWISGDGDARTKYIPQGTKSEESYIIIELKNLNPDVSTVRRSSFRS